jgi:hypothetical protein
MNYHDRSAGACEVNTAYPVMFFFQPWDRKYIPGWFTVEEMNGALDGTNDFMLAR